MGDIYFEISRLEKVTIDDIKWINHCERIIEELQDCFKEINGEMIPLYYADCLNVQLENLYTDLQLLKNIQSKKRKLLRINRFNI